MSTESYKVLVVDDTPEVLVALRSPLREGGFTVQTAEDGETALELVRSFHPDVVVLDVMLPRIDGLETCRRLRQISDAYILVLSAKGDEVDKLVGLSIGADDYMTKPFSPRELVARLQALLRRPRQMSDGSTTRVFGELVVDVLSREVKVGDELVHLTRTEFDLLDVLSSRPKAVFTRKMLLGRIWGDNWYGNPHVVDVHMAELRRKLGDDPDKAKFVRTLRGVGYRMARDRDQ